VPVFAWQDGMRRERDRNEEYENVPESGEAKEGKKGAAMNCSVSNHFQTLFLWDR
jgi:hypothetical protein